MVYMHFDGVLLDMFTMIGHIYCKLQELMRSTYDYRLEVLDLGCNCVHNGKWIAIENELKTF
jgi:hypothetical protein